MSFDFKKKIYDISVISLILSLSFSKAIPNIILVLIALFYLIFFFKKEELIQKVSHKIFVFLVLFLLIKKILNLSIFIDYQLFIRLIFLIIIPILFYSVPIKKIILSYISTVLVAIIISSLKTGLYYKKNGLLPFSNSSEVNELLFFERPYMGFACLTAALLSIYMIKLVPKLKMVFIILSIIFILFIFIIAARLSLITVVFIIVTYLFFYLRISLIKKTIIFVLGLFLVALALINYKNLSNRFFLKSNIETIKAYEPRLEIWPCAIEISKSEDFNIMFGSTSNNWIESKMVQCYSENITNISKKNWFIETKFNTHSQYLHFFLEGGLIGFFIFLIFSCKLIIDSRFNFYTFAVAFSIILFFLLENVLFRQFGAYILAILFSIIDKIKHEKN